MWQRFKERWQSEESRLGKILKHWVVWVIGALGIIGDLLQEASVIALQQYLSPKVFKVMAVCALISVFAGKLTKK